MTRKQRRKMQRNAPGYAMWLFAAMFAGVLIQGVL
jgi:hypothetical protein